MNISIRRIPRECPLFGDLQHLIPIGVNVTKLTEDEHDSLLGHPPPPPEAAVLEAVLTQIGPHQSVNGEQAFAVAEMKPDAGRITLIFASPDPITFQLVRALHRMLTGEGEIYLASTSFTFGVFVRTSGIHVWEAG